MSTSAKDIHNYWAGRQGSNLLGDEDTDAYSDGEFEDDGRAKKLRKQVSGEINAMLSQCSSNIIRYIKNNSNNTDVDIDISMGNEDPPMAHIFVPGVTNSALIEDAAQHSVPPQFLQGAVVKDIQMYDKENGRIVTQTGGDVTVKTSRVATQYINAMRWPVVAAWSVVLLSLGVYLIGRGWTSLKLYI